MAKWHRKSQQPRTQFEEVFETRVASIYQGMVQDAKMKKSAAGRITQVGREVPFTQFELYAWILLQLKNDRAGVVQCAYCRKFLSIADLTIDHMIPKKAPWNGSLGLENLTCCCGSCNSTKGRMSADGFRKLIEWSLLNLDERDMRDMMGRMANGSGYRPLRGRYMALVAKSKAGKPRPPEKIVGGLF